MDIGIRTIYSDELKKDLVFKNFLKINDNYRLPKKLKSKTNEIL